MGCCKSIIVYIHPDLTLSPYIRNVIEKGMGIEFHKRFNYLISGDNWRIVVYPRENRPSDNVVDITVMHVYGSYGCNGRKIEGWIYYKNNRYQFCAWNV
jgi:hypothetical protein